MGKHQSTGTGTGTGWQTRWEDEAAERDGPRINRNISFYTTMSDDNDFLYYYRNQEDVNTGRKTYVLKPHNSDLVTLNTSCYKILADHVLSKGDKAVKDNRGCYWVFQDEQWTRFDQIKGQLQLQLL